MVVAGKISDELLSLEELEIFGLSLVFIDQQALVAVIRVAMAVEAVDHESVLL